MSNEAKGNMVDQTEILDWRMKVLPGPFLYHAAVNEQKPEKGPILPVIRHRFVSVASWDRLHNHQLIQEAYPTCKRCSALHDPSPMIPNEPYLTKLEVAWNLVLTARWRTSNLAWIIFRHCSARRMVIYVTCGSNVDAGPTRQVRPQRTWERISESLSE